MVNFLTQFVPNLTDRMTELTELHNINIVFDFNGYYRTIFDQVKAVIAVHNTLGLYDLSQELVLEVDASQKVPGACLL